MQKKKDIYFAYSYRTQSLFFSFLSVWSPRLIEINCNQLESLGQHYQRTRILLKRACGIARIWLRIAHRMSACAWCVVKIKRFRTFGLRFSKLFGISFLYFLKMFAQSICNVPWYIYPSLDIFITQKNTLTFLTHIGHTEYSFFFFYEYEAQDS